MDGAPPNQACDSIDPDVDLRVPAPRRKPHHRPALLLAVISVGGAMGASARYGVSLAWPTAQGAFPWTTLAVNAAGCAAIGLLMVMTIEMGSTHSLVRPFLGTGVLGGFTTFSTYAVDVERLVDDGRPGMALGYLTLTVVVALGAVWTAASVTRRLVEVIRCVGRKADQ